MYQHQKSLLEFHFSAAHSLAGKLWNQQTGTRQLHTESSSEREEGKSAQRNRGTLFPEVAGKLLIRALSEHSFEQLFLAKPRLPRGEVCNGQSHTDDLE